MKKVLTYYVIQGPGRKQVAHPKGMITKSLMKTVF